MIRFVIKEAKLDHDMVCKALGISECTLRQIYKGRRPLRCSEWIYLCEKAEIACESLFHGVVIWTARNDPDRATIKWN